MELEAWLDAPAMPEGDLDLGDLAPRIGAHLAPERARKDLEQQRLELARSDAGLLEELLAPLVHAVAEVAPDMQQTAREEAMPTIRPVSAMGEPRVIAQWPQGVYIAGPGLVPMMFDMVALVAALDDGQIHVGGTYLVKRAHVIGTSFMQVYGPWRVEPGTAASRKTIYGLVDRMRDGLRPALEAFATALQ
jgi:hypothetical protein